MDIFCTNLARKFGMINKKSSKKLNKQTCKLMKEFSQISQLNDPNENTESCDYYDLNDFKKVIVRKEDLAVLHLNITSLSSHINELKLLLCSLKLNFSRSNLPTSNIPG